MPRDSGESRGATTAQAVVDVQSEDEVFLRVDVPLVAQVPGFTSIEGDTIHGDAGAEVDSVVVDQ